MRRGHQRGGQPGQGFLLVPVPGGGQDVVPALLHLAVPRLVGAQHRCALAVGWSSLECDSLARLCLTPRDCPCGLVGLWSDAASSGLYLLAASHSDTLDLLAGSVAQPPLRPLLLCRGLCMKSSPPLLACGEDYAGASALPGPGNELCDQMEIPYGWGRAGVQAWGRRCKNGGLRLEPCVIR